MEKKEFVYKPNKYAVSFIFLIFLVIGVWVIIGGEDPFVKAFGLVPFLGLILPIQMLRLNNKIITDGDTISIPNGFFKKKPKSLKINELIRVDEIEVNHNFSIHIEDKNFTTAEINRSFLKEEDYYYLLNFLKSNVEPGITSEKIVSKKRNEEKAKKIIAFALTAQFILFIVVEYVNSGLDDLEDFKNLGAKLAIISLINTIVIALTKRKNQQDQSPEPLSKIRSKENKGALIIAPGMVAGVVLIVISNNLQTERTIRENDPIVVWALMAGIVVSILLTINFKKFLDKYVSLTTKIVLTCLNVIFLTATFNFSALIANIYMDASVSRKVSTKLIKDGVSQNNTGLPCFKTNLNPYHKICLDDYPRIKNGQEVKVNIKKGNLGIPWIESYEFEHLTAFHKLTKIFGEEDLRSNDIEYFIKQGQKDEVYKNRVRWNSLCNSNPSYCRVSSYLEYQENDLESAKKFLVKGCKNDEFYSCYNYFFMDFFTKEEKLVAKNKMLKICDASKDVEKSETCNWIKELK